MIALVVLAVAASIAANSVVQMALGVGLVVAPGERRGGRFLAPAAAMALSGFLSWPLFAYILAPFSLGFLEPLLLFPLASLASVVADRIFSGRDANRGSGSAYSAFGGLAFGSAWLALRLSSGMLEAAVVSISCAAGFLGSGFLLDKIRYRSLIEPVPRALRGVPLALISAGLLSLLSTFVAAAAFTALGALR